MRRRAAVGTNDSETSPPDPHHQLPPPARRRSGPARAYERGSPGRTVRTWVATLHLDSDTSVGTRARHQRTNRADVRRSLDRRRWTERRCRARRPPARHLDALTPPALHGLLPERMPSMRDSPSKSAANSPEWTKATSYDHV